MPVTHITHITGPKYDSKDQEMEEYTPTKHFGQLHNTIFLAITKL